MSQPAKVKEYYIRAPSKTGRHLSFAIYCREGRGTPEAKTSKVSSSAIDATNQLYLSSKIDIHQARESLRAEVNRLRKQQSRYRNVQLNEINVQVLKAYWDARYHDKDLVDKESAYNRLKRALRVLEGLPITTASAREMQDKVTIYCSKKKIDGGRSPPQRDIIAALNQMLKFFGRSELRLQKNRKLRRQVKRLTLAEFTRVVSFVENKALKLLLWSAIGTGARCGELFSLSYSSLKEKELSIEGQIDRNLTERETKTRHTRNLVVLKDALPYLRDWLSLPLNDKLTIRHASHASILRKACKKAFPDEPDKHLVFHDLRHSYAIAWLSAGITIDIIAVMLGNSVSVCQEYYIGNRLPQGVLDRVNLIVFE